MNYRARMSSYAIVLCLMALSLVMRLESADSPMSGTNLALLPGKPLAEEEAASIAEKLISRVYVPSREIKSLVLEFKPQYVGLTDVFSRRSRGDAAEFPAGVRLGFFEGLMGGQLFDAALAQAQKAVFYWKRPETDNAERLKRNLAVVQLYDDKGKEIAIHPSVRGMLGMSCAGLLWLNRLPLVLPREPTPAKPGDPPFWEKEWYLNTDESSASLTVKFRAAAKSGAKADQTIDNSWQLMEIRYSRGDFLPLAMDHKIWEQRQNRWIIMDSSCEFRRLGQSNRVAVGGFGVNFPTRFDWEQIGDVWMVCRASGSRTAFDLTDRRKTTSWAVEFTHANVNVEIPDALLAWPDAEKVNLDFTSPDAAAETVLNCIRSGRTDLLPWCGVQPPGEAMPTKAPLTDLSYRFETFPGVRESLKLGEKKQEGENWIYRVEMLDPLQGRTRGAMMKIVPHNQEWRMQEDGPPLLFSLVYD